MWRDWPGVDDGRPHGVTVILPFTRRERLGEPMDAGLGRGVGEPHAGVCLQRGPSTTTDVPQRRGKRRDTGSVFRDAFSAVSTLRE